jgi:predicted nucleic acid-binding protein
LPTSVDHYLFDTSAAIAFVDADNPYHRGIWELASCVRRGLSGHANFEFFSVLTRLPLPKRLDRAEAIRLIHSEFAEPRFLPEQAQEPLLAECAAKGISGGMIYDALVAACARHHQVPLLTCDLRAEETYRLLGVDFVNAPMG